MDRFQPVPSARIRPGALRGFYAWLPRASVNLGDPTGRRIRREAQRTHQSKPDPTGQSIR